MTLGLINCSLSDNCFAIFQIYQQEQVSSDGVWYGKSRFFRLCAWDHRRRTIKTTKTNRRLALSCFSVSHRSVKLMPTAEVPTVPHKRCSTLMMSLMAMTFCRHPGSAPCPGPKYQNWWSRNRMKVRNVIKLVSDIFPTISVFCLKTF